MSNEKFPVYITEITNINILPEVLYYKLTITYARNDMDLIKNESLLADLDGISINKHI
jgi:hypothetical protein